MFILRDGNIRLKLIIDRARLLDGFLSMALLSARGRSGDTAP
jgi:hypothetical protein